MKYSANKKVLRQYENSLKFFEGFLIQQINDAFYRFIEKYPMYYFLGCCNLLEFRPAFSEKPTKKSCSNSILHKNLNKIDVYYNNQHIARV